MNATQIYKVPHTHPERSRLRELAGNVVGESSLVPPLSMDDLEAISGQLIATHRLDPDIRGWLMVEIHNAAWRDVIASIPYNKRVLLLPKCLSSSARCQADVDELGLICNRCRNCHIPTLEDNAENLGAMSIVAEGFTSVITLIENRVVDTVIGVGCLESLEKAFPLLINHAVPGIAIPLNAAGCKDTTVDYGYVIELMSMQSDTEAHLLDYDYLKSTLQGWFTKENLAAVLSRSDDHTSQIARDWMGGDGKRWRPYLLASVYLALSGEREIPEEVQLAAIAVECFHKASLVHDDIQDNDATRYGKQTVNAAHGVPIAINVGDALLGEGYRLLTGCANMNLLRVSADAHISLCRGQGMELEWSASPRPLTMDFVVDIFCNKTVPAFDVSLAMGVLCAGDDPELRAVLHDYSRALGIAYQLQDDLEDFDTDEPLALRPSSVLAAICELRPDAEFIRLLLGSKDLKAFLGLPENKGLLSEALDRVGAMAGQYHKEAFKVLSQVRNVELKRLLFRVTQRILK